MRKFCHVILKMKILNKFTITCILISIFEKIFYTQKSVLSFYYIQKKPGNSCKNDNKLPKMDKILTFGLYYINHFYPNQ